MKKLLTILSLSTILACQALDDGNAGPCGGFAGCPPEITVFTLDENDEAVTADDVYWYFAPDSSAYDGEHPMECGDIHCTKWVLPIAPSASFYVAGTREGPEHNDPYCGYSGYDGKPVEFADEPITITLDLSLHEWCE
jgi:hypothetical protein